MTYAEQLDMLGTSATTFIKERLQVENPIRLYDKQTADLEAISEGIPQFCFIDKHFTAEWVAVRQLTLEDNGEIAITGVFTGESYNEEITLDMATYLKAAEVIQLADFLNSRLHTFTIPVSWTMTAFMEIRAASKAEATTQTLDADLPQGIYCEDSFEVHYETIQENG